MQALPPPPPPIHCVSGEQAKRAVGYIVLSGDPRQLEAAIVELGPTAIIDAKAVNHGVGFARLKMPIDIKYKDLGAQIIRAQQRRLTVSVFTDPPLCGIDDE